MGPSALRSLTLAVALGVLAVVRPIVGILRLPFVSSRSPGEPAHRSKKQAVARETFSVLQAMVSGLIPASWVQPFIARYLDRPSRAALSCTNKACQQLVLQGVEQCTVTLRAHGGLGSAAWQRRLRAAEQALAARGEGRRTKLTLQCTTANTAALNSLLNMAATARRAVSAVEVFPGTDAFGLGLSPSWVEGFPGAYAHMRVLHLHAVWGGLPTPVQLPHLAELSVATRWSQWEAEFLRPVCVSVGAFTTQLSALSFTSAGHDDDLPWAVIFPRTTNTLRTFNTNQPLNDTLLKRLYTHVPRLQQLGCRNYLAGDIHATAHAVVTWGVQKLQLGGFVSEGDALALQLGPTEISAAALARLPQSAGELSLTIDSDLVFDVQESEGLSEAVRQRVGQWQLTAPCKARLLLPTVNDMIAVEQLRVSTQSALLELSSLPAGSTVRLYSGQLWRPAWLAACQAIAAVEPSLAHITVLPVSFPYEQLAIQELCAPDYPLPYGLLHKLPASDVVGPAYPHPWPWQSLRTGRVVLYRVCELPPVPDGMRPELWASEVFVEPDCKGVDTMPRLWPYLQRLTFVCNNIVCDGDDTQQATKPAALRTQLQCLSDMQVRPEPGAAGITLTLHNWSLTNAVINLLHLHLPTFDVPITLCLEDCDWVVWTSRSLQSLIAGLPSCVGTVALKHAQGERELSWTVQHLQAMCMGASKRTGGGRMKLLAHNRGRALTCTEQSEVELYLDEKKLRKWVELEW